jgi:hypothetical protein
MKKSEKKTNNIVRKVRVEPSDEWNPNVLKGFEIMTYLGIKHPLNS